MQMANKEQVSQRGSGEWKRVCVRARARAHAEAAGSSETENWRITDLLIYISVSVICLLTLFVSRTNFIVFLFFIVITADLLEMY